MIHGIYLRNRPKGAWHLVTTTASPESAEHDLNLALKQAKAGGNETAEAVIQIFESVFWVPMYLHTVKDSKPMFN